MLKFELNDPVTLLRFVRKYVSDKNVVRETVPPESKKVGSHYNIDNLVDCLHNIRDGSVLSDLFITR